MDEEKIIYKIEVKSEEKVDAVLHNQVTAILEKVNQAFAKDYEITSDEVEDAEDEWTHEIKIRKGSKVGAAIDFKWEKSNPQLLELEVEEASKLGNRIIYACLIGFGLLGAYMGSNDIAPLAFLPGSYKLAAGLGGLIGLIPGGIAVYVLKSFLLKEEEIENDELVAAIKTLLKS